METALDFVIDVFSPSPMHKSEVTKTQCRETEEWSRLKEDPPSQEDEHPTWLVVLYNDEAHTYADVISQLTRADKRQYDENRGRETAEIIDTRGRAPILSTKDLGKAVQTAQGIMKIGLFCCVRSERDYVRECIAGYILQWLIDCISVGVSVGGDEMILREVMCQALAGPWQMGISHPDPRVELDPEDTHDDATPNEGFHASYWDVKSPESDLLEERWVEKEYIRLDWILFFDARLWKVLRKCVKSIILGCLLGGKAEVAGSAVDPWGPRNWKRITGISPEYPTYTRHPICTGLRPTMSNMAQIRSRRPSLRHQTRRTNLHYSVYIR